MKALLSGKFIDILMPMLKNRENSQIKNLAFYLKKLEKEEQTKPKADIRKEIK